MEEPDAPKRGLSPTRGREVIQEDIGALVYAVI